MASALTIKAMAASAVVATCLAAAPVWGAGESSNPVPTCKKGEVYDQKAKKCVKKTSEALTDEDRTATAYALAKAERYTEALDILDTLKQPRTAEALNYRGYATRKLGRTEEGIGYYKQSVSLAPRYAKVREYLGEAYVIQGKMDQAREQLSVIETICGKGCEAYRDLAEAVEGKGDEG